MSKSRTVCKRVSWIFLQASDLLNFIKTSFDSCSKQLLKLPQVTILWFHLHLKGGLCQPSARLFCTSFTYSIRWLSLCETLTSSKHYPVDLPNWVNQRWSMETHSMKKVRAFSGMEVLQLCSDHCKWARRGLWILWCGPLIKGGSLLIARWWHFISCGLSLDLTSFYVILLFALRKEVVSSACEKSTCKCSTPLWWSPIGLVIP